MNRLLLLAVLVPTCFGAAICCRAVEFPGTDPGFPGTDPGAVAARLEYGRLVLENAALAVTWNLTEDRFQLLEVVDRISNRQIRPHSAEAFRIALAGGKTTAASQLQLVGEPSLSRMEPRPGSVRRSDQFAGWRATALLKCSDGALSVRWSATIRDRSNYVQQRVALEADHKAVEVASVTLLDLDVPGAEVAGTVSGSPVVAGNLFFACEHPLADNRVEAGRVVCSSPGSAVLRAPKKKKWEQSSVIGVVPPGQLRRGFLYYLERERARPYRLFLHYNSWWDIAWAGRKMRQEECLEVIETFGRELVEKRGVAIDAFVFDAGWDDTRSLWRFHSGFPRGFAPLQAAAEKYGSAVGAWLSPWGGYGQAKAERLEYGKTQGFETNRHGFSLAGPKYYARFAGVCKEMISKYGVHYFKFDGIAQGGGSEGAGGEFAGDVEALLHLAAELRRARPGLYLSITTGTWPSPYWLWYGDSVWRNGRDWGVHGVGSMRQQWITYRDMIVRRMIVDRAPLYPLNSLMIVSVCYARLGTAAKMAYDVDDLSDEIRMAFGGGSQLLELYVTPQIMKPEGWSELDALGFDPAHPWFRRYLDQLDTFVRGAAGKFGISHFILIDGLNFVFELVGATGTYLGLSEHPDEVRWAIELAFALNVAVQRAFFERTPLLQGGTCSNMVQWMPGRIVSESVDPFHMTSVDYLEKWGRAPVERILSRFDGGVIHIHGNGRHLLEAVCEFKGLKAVFLGDDRGFPPAFEVLEKLQRRTGDVPLVVEVDFDRFAERLNGHRLPGGVLYRVSGVPDVDTANRWMEKVRAYAAY